MERFYNNIEPYLLGELSGDDLTAFEKALHLDPSLAKSVAQHSELMQRLDALRLRDRVKSSIREEQKKPALRIAYKTTLAILAALTLIFGALWFFDHPAETSPLNPNHQPSQIPPPPNTPADNPIAQQPSKVIQQPNESPAPSLALARKYFEQPNPGFIRSVQTKAEQKSALQLAAEAYGDMDYRRALAYLGLISITPQDEEALYLRANAYFQVGRFANAAQDFDRLKDSFQFKHNALWNLLLCQIALGETDKAKVMLSKIVGDVDAPFHKKALDLEAQIKKQKLLD